MVTTPHIFQLMLPENCGRISFGHGGGKGAVAEDLLNLARWCDPLAHVSDTRIIVHIIPMRDIHNFIRESQISSVKT